MAGFQDKDLYKTPGVYNPPDAVFTVFMELPQNIPKKLGVLIGPNGRIFKAITHQSGSKYIWCNGKNIEISADKIECISDAIKRIYARCDYLETKAKRTGRPVARVRDTTCGICDFSDWRSEDIRNCTVCHGHLCKSIQKGPRTICTPCIMANGHKLGDIFTDGKDAKGCWIDPGTHLPLPTCPQCGRPCLPMQCTIMGCI